MQHVLRHGLEAQVANAAKYSPRTNWPDLYERELAATETTSPRSARHAIVVTGLHRKTWEAMGSGMSAQVIQSTDAPPMAAPTRTRSEVGQLWTTNQKKCDSTPTEIHRNKHRDAKATCTHEQTGKEHNMGSEQGKRASQSEYRRRAPRGEDEAGATTTTAAGASERSGGCCVASNV